MVERVKETVAAKVKEAKESGDATAEVPGQLVMLPFFAPEVRTGTPFLVPELGRALRHPPSPERCSSPCLYPVWWRALHRRPRASARWHSVSDRCISPLSLLYQRSRDGACRPACFHLRILSSTWSHVACGCRCLQRRVLLPATSQGGKYQVTVRFMCQTWVGCDFKTTLTMNVRPFTQEIQQEFQVNRVVDPLGVPGEW